MGGVSITKKYISTSQKIKELENGTHVVDLLQLNDAVKLSMDSVVIGNLEGKIVDANEVTLKMFEFEEKDDLVGKNFFSFIRSNSSEDISKNIEKVVKNGQLKTLEKYVITGSGNTITVEMNIDVMKNQDGKPIGFIGITRDITEQKRTEEALQQAEEKYQALFNSSPEVVTLIGLDGTILDCNEVTEKITGKQKKQLIGKPINDLKLFTNEEIMNLLEFFPKADDDNIQDTIDMAIQYGKEKGWVEVIPTVIRKGDEVYALQLIARDITEKKRTEEEMKRKLMRFKLDHGKIYIVEETRPAMAVEALKDLIKVGYHGVIVSRTPEKDFKRSVNKGDTEFLWLAENGEENTQAPKLNDIKNRIEDVFRNLPKKSGVLIEGMEYLIFKNGFSQTLTFLQHLRELAYLTGNIVLISIDPTTLNNQELRLFEKEGSELEPRSEKKKLPKEQLKILKFIYQNNIMGVKPSYTSIGQELGISKPTVRKRIRYLISTGYIQEIIRGRNKVVELSQMGKNLFC